MDVAKVHDEIIQYIKDFYKDKVPENVVIGISGGKDSTICAKLLAEALGPENVYGVMMPNGKQRDIQDSKDVIEMLGIKSLTVNIGGAFMSISEALEMTLGLKNGFGDLKPSYMTNTPARLRMVTLYGIAAQVGAFVVNTCNLSESVVGWETYGGDGFGDFSPLGRLTVSEVLELGDYMGIPERFVHKAPSDGMCGATDEDKLGFTYAELDATIRDGVVGEHFEKICLMNKASHFKHENIHIPTYDPGFHINSVFNW